MKCGFYVMFKYGLFILKCINGCMRGFLLFRKLIYYKSSREKLNFCVLIFVFFLLFYLYFKVLIGFDNVVWIEWKFIVSKVIMVRIKLVVVIIC